MRKILTLLPSLLLLGALSGKAQIFWTENFESGSTAGAAASSYVGPNGAWAVTSTGTNDGFANKWYVSCAENGYTSGLCGTGCVASSTTATLATLHVGASSTDAGASYLAGPGLGATAYRAESPTINCTGKVGITLSFYYIENGDGTNDNGTVWYYNGSTWALLVDPAKTPLTCSPQGTWTHYTFTLPASADNNANVKIGFNWVNDVDGVGTDPSYAVDSVSLSTAGSSGTPDASMTASSTTVCSDSCATFTSTSTGTASIDSFVWSCPGATIATPHASPASICFPTFGSYTVKLYLYDAGIRIDSASTAMTVKKSPTPVIIKTGSVLSVSGSYTSYQWYTTITPIPGATNSSYTYTTPGIYGVMVDSNGCKGIGIKSTTAVGQVDGSGNTVWIAQQPGSTIPLFAAQPLEAALAVGVYDATGRAVATGMWEKGTSSLIMNNVDVPAGIYIVKLGNDNTSIVLRWLRE